MIGYMTQTKKNALPYGRPKLAVVRNLVKVTELPRVEESKILEKDSNVKKWMMPEQLGGYIKTRKHDCL